MADNFLEYHREDYEKKKAEWLRKKRHLPKSTQSRKNYRTSRRRITLIVNIKIGKDQMLLSFPIICLASS